MHIKDYVENTNETFAQLPFNNVDAAVLCALFYGRIENVIEGESHHEQAGIPVRDFYKQEYFSSMFNDGITDNENRMILTVAAASPRFRDIKVYNVCTKDDVSSTLQFAAAIFEIDKETDFVCFRGTDGSINGWQEDFKMVFMDEIPAQSEAVNYLNNNYGVDGSRSLCKRLYVAGHSKGGNLAIYGATMCEAVVKTKIDTVYSLDGPGFKEDVIESLAEVWDKNPLNIVKILPQKSLVGLIMQDKQDAQVIRSDARLLIMHHSLYTWLVEDNDFVYVDNLSNFSEVFDDTLSEWIDNATPEETRIFVEVFFHVLSDNNLETVTDLKHLKLADIRYLIATIKDIPPEKQEVVHQLLNSLWRSAVHANVASVREALGMHTIKKDKTDNKDPES